ncbi:MAG TPA: ATP-binding protein [Verrucomicrobiae bacterium]|nr:ATP-binding protein [Verrucomicrobiae bacterium]
MQYQTSIKHKVMTVIMLTSVAVLLVTVIAFAAYDFLTFRQSLVRNLSTEAQMLAENSTAALAFKNDKDAEEILSSLDSQPHVVAAALYDADGKLFVKYPPQIANTALPPIPQKRGYRFGTARLTLFQPVMQSGVPLGTLYLQSDLSAITTRLKLYGVISLGIMLGSLLVAFWISNTLQRRISNPVVALAETARKISDERNYSVRAAKFSDDELGYLTEAFNSMLDQIQATHSELRRSREHVQVIADHASVHLCQIDRQHRYTFVNRTFAERYDTTPELIVGKPISEVTGQQAYESFKSHLEKAFAGQRVEYEMEIAYNTFGPRWVHAVYMPERDLNGQIVAVVAVINDITDRKRIERELERARDDAVAASHAKDEFLAALSHELRTPLNPVLLLASEGAATQEFSPEVRQTFNSIAKNVSLEARLIDDLLDLTRITRNKLPLEMQVIDVHAVLKNAIETVRSDFDQKQITLGLALAASPLKICGDAVRLQQIFWNVLKNAVKFTDVGGRVSIATHNEDHRMFIEISDTGIGMTAAERERVFDAFAQGEHAASHRFGGLGLGLAISQRLVQLHSGMISAASDGRGKGATFTIEFPLLDDVQQKSCDGDATVVSRMNPKLVSSGGKVLLVEDHEPTRLALTHLLQRRHFEVVPAATIAEARAAAEKVKIDFLISDIGLPDGDGYGLMAELQKLHGLKGIALTGYGREDDIARSQNAGFVTHLTKPVHVRALENALETLIASQRDG